MDSISILIFSIAMFGNIVVIYWKIKRGNAPNALLDFVILAILTYIFGGSTAGLAIATITSALFSIYLFFDPISIDTSDRTSGRSRRKNKRRNLRNI